jgi:hypothetical protein
MATFASKAAHRAIDLTVPDVFRQRRMMEANLDAGIEVEVEGRNLPDMIGKFWGCHKDGSLRGESMEYTLNAPIPQAQINEAMNVLDQAFINFGSKINDSYRTSVHVHINAQHMKIRDVYTFICLYMTLEELLIDLCGRQRAGNLFCLRSSDAEFLTQTLKNSLRTGHYANLSSDQLRYCAINVAALGKYGSIEFRAYRGTTDKEAISLWAHLLCELRNSTIKFKNPQDLCEQFSKIGPKAFLSTVFPDTIAKIFYRAKDFEERLYQGVRNAQDIAYSIKSWEPFANVEAPAVTKYGLAPVADEAALNWREAAQGLIAENGFGFGAPIRAGVVRVPQPMEFRFVDNPDDDDDDNELVDFDEDFRDDDDNDGEV